LLRARNGNRVTFVIPLMGSEPDQQGMTSPVGAKHRQGSRYGVK